ncbi:hypothetical protein JOC78_000790 [Bacillus ectoiniformans]|uniref:hypothetical protein n=1 Tax=Bacillus ectoiniformans TaxID=1494429 RepID=UPI00195B745C|nr:hypothetical protein [Bacillus ectoiniformans]MBM7647850.1 hypothetical protein [Bacillus ectoiniformans]
MLKKTAKILIVCTLFLIIFNKVEADQMSMPTKDSLYLLQDAKGKSGNSKGAAMVSDIHLNKKDWRTSISVHAIHLPDPEIYGMFNGYEAVAYVPDEILSSFPLQKIHLKKDQIWAGKNEDHSADIRPSKIEIRPYHSSTGEYGPAVLTRIHRK